MRGLTNAVYHDIGADERIIVGGSDGTVSGFTYSRATENASQDISSIDDNSATVSPRPWPAVAEETSDVTVIVDAQNDLRWIYKAVTTDNFQQLTSSDGAATLDSTTATELATATGTLHLSAAYINTQ
jgi:hypothetical protein